MQENNPKQSTYDLLYRLYPYKSFLQKDGINSIEGLLGTLNVKSDNTLSQISRNLEAVKTFFNEKFNKAPIEQTPNSNKSNYIETDYQNFLIGELLESSAVGDICLIGPRGCGKSTTINKLAEILNFDIEPIVLYQDMTARDLIQQRTTELNGDTVWKNSPLIMAALDGKMAVLDGIHRIHPSTLAVLHRLVHDREIQLHDGRRLISAEKYDNIMEEYELTEEVMIQQGILKVDPRFRIVALAEPPSTSSAAGNWLSSELLSLFLYNEMRTLSKEEEMQIITNLVSTESMGDRVFFT